MEYSVVVPVYRSAGTLCELVEELNLVLAKTGGSFEIIMVEDCGGDNSWEILKSLKEKYAHLKIIKLMKNYGQHNAIMCGFSFAEGNYVITIDDDLQNPPDQIHKLITEIKKGYDVVYGIYEQKKHNWFRNIGSNLILLVYRKTFNASNKLTSFRVIRKNIVEMVLKYNKNYTFLDGLIAWYTKNIGMAIVEHKPRGQGSSGYTISKLINLSINMITNFSIMPLRIIALSGILFALSGFCLGSYMAIRQLTTGIPVLGYASIMVTITFFSGIQLITVGIIGEYLGRIHLNINDKPQFAIRETII